MEDERVLVVSDSPDRMNFLSYHIRFHGMRPISYPNYWSARHALEVDFFGMIVVDLTLPIDSKLELVKTACLYQESARVMTIGKTLYLENAGALQEFASVERLASIQEFPEKLGVNGPGEGERNPDVDP